jgi:hypothetical protein
MRFCFVSTTRGSYFMTELMAALATATEASGHVAELVFDVFPPLTEHQVYVAVPHEFEAWGDPAGFPSHEQRARTIALCTENPGTPWFESTYRLVAGFGAAVSINRSSAAELRRRGVRCEHLQLGYSAHWDHWRGDEGTERAIDVLYLGAADPRRDPLLAGIGASLWSRNCQFLVPPLEPRQGPRADFLKEQDKYARLGGAKILLNLHRTTSAAFEWMRFLEAICNGCVVVSEPSLDSAPLIAGEHFEQAPVERIADTANALLDDPARLRALRERAYEFVRKQLSIGPAGERLVELAGELLSRQSTASELRGPVIETVTPGAGDSASASSDPAPSPSAAAASLDITVVLAQACAATQAEGFGLSADASGGSSRRGALRAIARPLGRLRRRAESGELESPAYAAASARVSALVAIAAGREQQGIALLECVAASGGEEIEILAMIDRSSCSCRRAVARFLDRHRRFPILALSGDASELGVARNLLADRARGEHLLVLPDGGGIFPTTVGRLSQALEAEQQACFSYPMVAVVDGGASVELRGSMPWEPARLTRENWIDAPAMIRRERLIEIGGYATDRRLRGLEDFDLWCRFADTSGHAVHVPQVLGWRPTAGNAQPHDVAALPPASGELIAERCPHLFAGARAGGPSS